MFQMIILQEVFIPKFCIYSAPYFHLVSRKLDKVWKKTTAVKQYNNTDGNSINNITNNYSINNTPNPVLLGHGGIIIIVLNNKIR